MIAVKLPIGLLILALVGLIYISCAEVAAAVDVSGRHDPGRDRGVSAGPHDGRCRRMRASAMLCR